MKRLVKWFLLVVGLVLVVIFSRDLVRLSSLGNQQEVLEAKLQALKQENAELQARKEYVQSAEFVEQEARNKLNMVRPGETLVILPTGVESQPTVVEHPDPPNYVKWWRLFFE